MRVCEAVPFDYDLTPCQFMLSGREGTGTFRADFDQVVVREFIRPPRD
jgi:hypothetical protein